MKDLHLPGSQSTPSITANPATGVLAMRGDSYPENAFELYGPVIEWVEAYLAQADEPLRMELELLYLNTSSIKAVMDIFDILQAAHDSGRQVAVNWYYDLANKRVGELAEEFTEDYNFAFQVIGRE
nr:DUF1987 domain-containing protein [Pseudomonas sp.]